MPLYNNLNASQKLQVDTYYQNSINSLLNTMLAINQLRFDPGTDDNTVQTLDARYADLQNQLGLLEKESLAAYSSTQPITSPTQAQVDAVTALATQADQLNNNQAKAAAVLAFATTVLDAAQSIASA